VKRHRLAASLAVALALAAHPLRAADGGDSAEARGAEATIVPVGEPLVLRAVVADPITPVSARFMTQLIDAAEERGADLALILLDTPGGLDTAMREAVKRILASEVPVAVYVAPPGSRAASAGVFITMAAHVAAMAPGTNIGAAHPVNLGGGMDSTMAEKATNDAVAYARSIARRRGRNEEWAERAVRESVALSSADAVRERVVDLEAPTVDSLLAAIDGREVDAGGATRLLRTRGARIEEFETTFRDRVLAVISNPNVAYVLMLLGVYGLIFELSNPGAVLPGILGGISLILAFYAFQSLPLNYAGVLLVLLGMILLVLEVKVTSHGVLTIGGVASFTLGSLMLVRSPLPFLRVSLAVIAPAVLTTAAFFLAVVGAGLRAQRRRHATGQEALVGERAVARTPLSPRGQVMLHGEIWNAESSAPADAGRTVIVDRVEGLLLRVTPAEPEERSS
jgi:membrane-bound serine protease (ClpP class)